MPATSAGMTVKYEGGWYKPAVSIVSDYAPGHDAEQWFAKSYAAGGGKVLERLRVPLANPDFAPFLQRARDAAPLPSPRAAGRGWRAAELRAG